MADAQKLVARLAALRGERQLHEQVWKDCFDYSLPELGSGINGHTPFSAGETQGQRAKLLDGTAADGLDTLADGFMYGLNPKHAQWFQLDVGEESHEERMWLDAAAKLIWEKLHASNFDAEAHDAMKCLGGAGWFCLYQDERRDGQAGYYFENWPIGECFVASTRAGGLVDTIYREFEMTAASVVAEFGDRCSEAVQKQAMDPGKRDERVKILWAIEPRSDYMPGSRMAGSLPFASYKCETATKHTLSEGGYHEFPVMVPRWSRIPGSVYGVGPMSRALPDVKTLQEVKRWELAAAETVIAPPLKVVDDGVINPRMVKLGPRKVLVCADPDNIQPLITGAKVEFGQLLVADLQAAVRRPLMADLFTKLFEDPRMTATQVHAIMSLIRQRLGPRFGRLQAEYAAPLIDRSFGIAFRAGALGPPPPSLVGMQTTPRYQSPLAMAQQLEEVTAMDRYEQGMLLEAQVVPNVLDMYDWDEALRHKARLLGVPLRLIPDARKVAKARQDKAEAAQAAQQQQVELMGQAAGAEAMGANMAGA